MSLLSCWASLTASNRACLSSGVSFCLLCCWASLRVSKRPCLSAGVSLSILCCWASLRTSKRACLLTCWATLLASARACLASLVSTGEGIQILIFKRRQLGPSKAVILSSCRATSYKTVKLLSYLAVELLHTKQ